MMFRFALLVLAFVSSLAAAQVQRYERSAVRDQLLELVANPPRERLVVQGAPDEKAKPFLDMFLDEIHPYLIRQDDLGVRYTAYHLLLDSASYVDEAEKKKWQEALIELDRQDNADTVDPKVTEMLKRWAELSEGLTGELPDMARRMHERRELGAFSEEMQPKLDELGRLSQAYSDALNTAPAAGDLGYYTEQILASRRDFKAGKITLEEGKRITDELKEKYGENFVGYQAVQATGDNLNRAAVLRTELAKSKGFANWAEYMLRLNGEGYEAPYRGPENQKKFLREYIAALAPLFREYFEQRLAEMGLKDEKLVFDYIGLYTPRGLAMLQPYFPAGELTNIWEKALLASGFSPETLAQIIVDDLPRDGKNATSAYKATVLSPTPAEGVLDAKSLNIADVPHAQWKRGLMYILQNYHGAGLSDLSTAFHEGGHALEAILKYKDESTPEGYGSVEVPSTSMEHFTEDAEFLWKNAVPVNGQKPSLEEIKELVANSNKVEIFQVLGGAVNALFDLELWAYDYTAPGAQTYLQRVEALAGELDRLAGFPEHLPSPVPQWYSRVSTPHFTSGSVRYIGYVYADIASRMMVDFITEEMVKASGRESWSDQPTLGRLLSEKYYSQAWKQKFPGNIEAVTGRKFDPEAGVRQFEELIRGRSGDGSTTPCSDGLETSPRK